MGLPRFTMYTRSACGLCERMREQLEASIAPFNAALTCVDIEGHEDLEARFGSRVPVLYAGDRELCFGRLDMDLLEEALANNR